MSMERDNELSMERDNELSMERVLCALTDVGLVCDI